MLIQTRCAFTGTCHGGTFQPDFSGNFEDGRLVDPTPVTLSCRTRRFIDPVDPDQSSIVEKISRDDPCEGAGTRMPPPNNSVGSAPLTPDETQCLIEWVNALAAGAGG